MLLLLFGQEIAEVTYEMIAGQLSEMVAYEGALTDIARCEGSMSEEPQ